MRNNKSNVIVNFIYNAVYQLLLIFLPLITTPYISRVLHADGVGLYSYSYSIASFFALVGMLGVNNYGSRTIATYQQDKIKRSEAFWNIYTVQSLMSLCVLIAYVAYILFFCAEKYRIISCVQIIAIICSVFDINWFFFGMEKFKLTVTRNIIIKFCTVVGIFSLVKQPDDVYIYAALSVGSLLISNIVIWPYIRKETVFIRPTWSKMKTHIPQLFVLFIPVLAISIYNKMDKVMLGYMSTLTQNGLYESAERIVNIPMGLITALGTVMLPRMTCMFSQGNHNGFQKYMQTSMEFVIFLSSAMTFGIASIANEFSPLFFGNGYEGVVLLIVLISPTILIKAWANVIRTQYLIPLHHDKIYVNSVCMGAVVNLAINFICIPKLQAVGAVIGTIVAELVVMIYQTSFVRDKLPITSYLKSCIYYIVAGMIMALSVRIFANNSALNLATLVIEILIGAIIYISLCIPYVYIKHKKYVILFAEKIISLIKR